MKVVTEIHQMTPAELIQGVVDAIEKKKVFHQKRKYDNEYLTRKETADLLRISLVSLHNWTMKGILTKFKRGKRVVYKAEDVYSVMQEQEV